MGYDKRSGEQEDLPLLYWGPFSATERSAGVLCHTVGCAKPYQYLSRVSPGHVLLTISSFPIAVTSFRLLLLCSGRGFRQKRYCQESPTCRIEFNAVLIPRWRNHLETVSSANNAFSNIISRCKTCHSEGVTVELSWHFLYTFRLPWL